MRERSVIRTCKKFCSISIILISAISSFSCAFSKKDLSTNYSKDGIILAKANEGIEKYRKGELNLKFVDKDGKPLSGLTVKYNQISHQFLFGIYDDYNTLQTGKLKEAGVNYATLHFNQNLTEPEFGSLRFDVVNKIWNPDDMSNLGFALQGHALIYMMKESTPPYLISVDFQKYKEISKNHIRELVEGYRDKIKFWNIINEPTSKWSNVNNYSIPQIIELIKDGIEEIRESNSLDKNIKIIINHHNPAGEGHSYSPIEFTQDLEKQNVDYDIIGLQFYYNGYSEMFKYKLPRKSIYEMSKIIDQYSNFKKEIHITELSVPSGKVPISELIGYNNIEWSSDLQAKYLNNCYTLFFSKKNVKSITWWDGDDNSSFIYKGGLFTSDSKPKKSFYALRYLLKQWMTSGVSATDKNGNLKIRGFGGEYFITIKDPKSKITYIKKVHLKEQESLREEIILE